MTYLREIKYERDKVSDHETYPFNIPALKGFKGIKFDKDVTFIVGENGAGKSTLVESIAVAMGFSPEGGTKNVKMDTSSSTSNLHEYFKVIRNATTQKDGYFLRAESFVNVATYMDNLGLENPGYGDKKLHESSHGESFMATLTIKLKGKGLYIFDEPEAALSPSRQMAALTAINDLVKKNSQFIIATHSPILMAYPGAKILFLSEDGISEVAYEDTEHYCITKEFLNNHRRMLKILMED